MPPLKRKRGRPPGSKNKKKNKCINGIVVKKEKIIKCVKCYESFESVYELEKHIQCCEGIYEQHASSKKAAYACNECPKKFKFKNSYEQHLLKEHSKLEVSVECDHCSVRCPDKATLAEHIEKIHQRNIYECPHCQAQFVRSSHVLRHMAQRGCDGKGITLYPCEICERTFTRKDNLMVHLRLQHILKAKYSCKQCNYKVHNFSRLIKHWLSSHADPPNQFQCHHCGKVTHSRAAMSKHLEIHGDKKFTCDVCGYKTFTAEVMRRHVLTHVEDKPYKCSLCTRSYIQRAQLQRHLEKHSGNMCDKCGETFSSKAGLLIHRRAHMGLKKLFCPVQNCSLARKEFSNETFLSNHLKLHVNDKQYKCEVCSKEFHSEVNMRRHTRTHQLDRPRRCMYCVTARAYVRGDQLVRHVRTAHPDVFRVHLAHVRTVLGVNVLLERVRKSEMESILNVLDAESDRILQGYGGSGVLYGGMVDQDDAIVFDVPPPIKCEPSSLMSEEELVTNLSKLLSKLIDKETLECFGWPEENVDTVLEKVIQQCGARAADARRWSRVQCLRENAKQLFLRVVEDAHVARMLASRTIDQLVRDILHQVDATHTTHTTHTAHTAHNTQH